MWNVPPARRAVRARDVHRELDDCLTEALGLALPGNGTLLATHVDRDGLFLQAGRTIVSLTRPTHEKDDESVLPRAIANRARSTTRWHSTSRGVQHPNPFSMCWAAAHEGGVEFGMADVDASSRRVPHICQVAPASGGIRRRCPPCRGVMAILAELDRVASSIRGCRPCTAQRSARRSRRGT